MARMDRQITITFAIFVVVAAAARTDAFTLDDFVLADEYCSPLAYDRNSPEGVLSDRLLVDFLKYSYSKEHRHEPSTCYIGHLDGATQWAQGTCAEPGTAKCAWCLAVLAGEMEVHCRFRSGGRVNEKHGICRLRFGDIDVCAL